jgi:putative ABC transport system permease protein
MINAMSSMGLVSIPGMMTGQILGGQGPQEAAIIQIIMMILIATGVYLGVLAGLGLARFRLYDKRGIACF